MGFNAFMFPWARKSEPRVVPAGTFGREVARRAPIKSDVVPRPSQAELDTWTEAEAEVFRLSLPSDVPPAEVFPDLETALLAAADQLQRTPTQPELPPIADVHRRSKV